MWLSLGPICYCGTSYHLLNFWTSLVRGSNSPIHCTRSIPHERIRVISSRGEATISWDLGATCHSCLYLYTSWSFRIDDTNASGHSYASFVWSISLHGNLIAKWPSILRPYSSISDATKIPTRLSIFETRTIEKGSSLYFHRNRMFERTYHHSRNQVHIISPTCCFGGDDRN